MFDGKQIKRLTLSMQSVDKRVDDLIKYIMKRDIKAQVEIDDAPAMENKKIMDLLSKQAKLIAKVELLTKENIDLEKRARPKRKNKKSITKKAHFTQVSEDEKVHFLEMYDAGMSTLEMSVASGRSGGCITTWIKKLRPEDFLED